MQIIIIGECLLVEQITPDSFQFEIHFKGPYRGNLIQKVLLYKRNKSLSVGEEYVLHVEVLQQEGRILYGNILRHKNIKYIETDIF